MALIAYLFHNALPIAAVLAAVYLARKFLAYHRLRHFSGPRWTGLSDWPLSLAMFGSEVHEWFAAANREHGALARVAPNILVTSSPDVWMRVNTQPKYERTGWYYRALRIEYQRDNVFSQADGEMHEKRRVQMIPGYSGRENLALEDTVDEAVHNLIALIRTKYISTESRAIPMDLAKKIQFFTLDVISSAGLGKAFGMLRADADVHGFLKSIEDGIMVNGTVLALGLSWLAQAPLVGRLLAPAPGDGSPFGSMMETCFRYVDERAANPTDKRSDMLASFMRHGLEGDELRSEALEQVLAGSDTTAGSIRAMLLHVMGNPRVHAALRREIDDAVARGIAPAEGSGIISAAQARRLPYLQAVIREGWRMFPPVPGLFLRDVPSGGDTVELEGGERIFIPGGTHIGYSGVAMHRDPKIYAPDADVFRPERWFDPDERLGVMNRVIELTFGHGRWKCLGRPVAQLEIVKVVFELIRNFDMAMMDPAKPWKAQNFPGGLFVISDIWVQVMERK